MKNEKISTGVWTGVPSFDPFSFQWSVRYSLGESSIIKMIDFGSRRKSLALLLNILIPFCSRIFFPLPPSYFEKEIRIRSITIG